MVQGQNPASPANHRAVLHNTGPCSQNPYHTERLRPCASSSLNENFLIFLQAIFFEKPWEVLEALHSQRGLYGGRRFPSEVLMVGNPVPRRSFSESEDWQVSGGSEAKPVNLFMVESSLLSLSQCETLCCITRKPLPLVM